MNKFIKEVNFIIETKSETVDVSFFDYLGKKAIKQLFKKIKKYLDYEADSSDWKVKEKMTKLQSLIYN